jgi:glycosyltransferase involved in cell wall biosynthesis
MAKNPLASGPPARNRSAVSTPLRILYAWDRLLPTTATDAEQATSTMAALSRRGHEVTALLPAPLSKPGISADELLRHYKVQGKLQVQHVRTPLAEQLLIRKGWFAAYVARGGTLPPHDVVYTRNSATFLALVSRGEKVVYDTHRAWPDHVPPLAPLFKLAMSRPAFLGAVFHSDYARTSYERLGVDPWRLATMRNGFDPARFQSHATQASARRELDLPADRKLVVYTGHISALKGLGSVLELAQRCPEALFLLVGSEGDGSVERAAKRHSNVRVLPWQPYDVAAKYMVSADVLLLPPSNVGLTVAGHTVLPMKLYGYLAAGRAVFAPRTPDVEELLVDGDNAVLVPPGNVEHAGRRLADLLADDSLRERLAARARETGKELTWDARAQKLERFIEARL